MCEFCTSHGDGGIWYKNAANFATDLLADIKRRRYIEEFFQSTIGHGNLALGRLESLYQKKGRLPARVTDGMVAQAKTEHFGQVLPIEEIEGILQGAASVVRFPCACRWAAEKKENRCCYGISYGAERWFAGLDFSWFGDLDVSGFEQVPPAEALAQMRQMEKGGAVHSIWTMVTPFIGAVCNCTPQECLALRSMHIGVGTVWKAEQVAQVDSLHCDGCGLCQEICPFEAVSAMHCAGGDVAQINAGRCYGCGLCRGQCPAGAIRLVDRFPDRVG